MRPIQMVDTHSQYLAIKPEVDAAIHEVLDTAAYINGKAVQQFTRSLGEYLQVKHTIPCANGTDALQIAMMALGLQPGDEVITPSFTYIATTEVVALLKLTPVFVEVDPQTFCIDPVSVRKAITPKTKAIVPVHLYGHAAPMEEIMAIAKEFGLFVIEDNAQAIGCDYTFSDGTKKKTGTIGTIGATSFYPSKNLGAYGDGGAIFTNDDALAHQMKMIANHGQQKRYYHEVVGCNSRLDSIQAAVLNIKLKKLDQYNAARQAVAAFYNKAFANHPAITTPFVASYSTHVYHQYTLQLKGVDREGLVAYIAEHKIPSMIYYPVPGHKQDMFASFGLKEILLPVTDELTNSVISLPIHTEMNEEQLNYICTHVLNFINK
ncbi:MAG: transcriptional regulator [Sphingobacteriia bacterium 24-36-13]|jgi:dTDP-4-amino-4,6-dideoxygalactose transaminase|uniref:DegT/DnrJ/EryC1/StrS family aminotransferase n=1 Tax=Sediminibacterium sp. TaxID=1917865 RepID=UPI000BD54D1F|nr:DegT/DnrJ/EryC1/StrS family aminotransferase [Sediminibacterium sp.]OYY11924.1 MAG: transcriptional regulator [Sphingobacteriia bacterium 35-36-14]OYZ54158.1 MAG: transcriptional regulator [Sphingobacteriia bacterium 24-36-13]OZA64257.1 MAG: transcriptional regulator [Sphingobacteriia bacterium 39-36-14]HQS24807.1 DegT/DnrJ/EryC1/StrS family aminotransferase [Sediminibacterium sp.]HQS34894.1 DegT/DnrJ/EryC1/StrS family aminotransferase [Sediminibacterium sp.]